VQNDPNLAPFQGTANPVTLIQNDNPNLATSQIHVTPDMFQNNANSATIQGNTSPHTVRSDFIPQTVPNKARATTDQADVNPPVDYGYDPSEYFVADPDYKTDVSSEKSDGMMTRRRERQERENMKNM
jgi:hypothetical protein